MKILYVTTISLTMNSFFKPHIEMLIREGHTVDIACNATDLPLDALYHELGCRSFQIDFSRSPLSPMNIRAYKQMKDVIENGAYDIVHCHTPNAAVITRLVCRKHRKQNGLRVFYTAHGFHFYKGAPLINWLVYYPVEKICAHFTDVQITINKEDYELAQKRLKAGRVEYVPGVGVDLSKFDNITIDKAQKRCELGIPQDAMLLLSAGELNKNKNHRVIIRALAQLQRTDIHYAVAGDGDKWDYLLKLAEDLGVSDQVHLLGYRKDIPEIMYASDIFCFPSLREGLGIAAIEAMAAGLPIVTSDVHGINDYSENGVTGYKCSPTDYAVMSQVIRRLTEDEQERSVMGAYNRQAAQKYDIKPILATISEIYRR